MIDCSVIIPHLNQEAFLSDCLSALGKQSLAPERFEIIVVDNGSDEIVPGDWKRRFNRVTWIKNDRKKNPYTSRNLGVWRSKARTVAFLDAQCIPNPRWLETGLERILRGHDLVAGKFEMNYPSERLLDRAHGLLYLQNRKNVKMGFGVPAGNLFVNKTVFEEIGQFKDQLITGNDIEWSKRAISAGYKLGYESKASVSYMAKPYNKIKADMRKYAIGAVGHSSSEKDVNKNIIRSFFPMKPRNFMSALRYRELQQYSWHKKMILWLALYQLKVLYGMSMIKTKLVSWREKNI